MTEGKHEAIQCSICKVILVVRSGVYVHASSETNADHAAVPEPFDPANAVYKCDFCGVERQDVTEAYTLPANDFPDPVIPNAWARGGWCACPLCATRLQDDDWDGLLDRALAAMGATGGLHAAFQSWLSSLYERLRDNITGPLRPYKPGDEQC